MTGQPLIDHVTLWARDLPASRRFYEAALAPLGFGLEFERDGLLAFGSGESGRLIIYASERPVAGFHVAFSAPSREAVDRFHAAWPGTELYNVWSSAETSSISEV